MTENYDPQCVEETLKRHSKGIKDAVFVDETCQSAFTLGGSAAGLVLGPTTAWAGAMVGAATGYLICDDLSGVDEAIKPPSLSHCETKGPMR